MLARWRHLLAGLLGLLLLPHLLVAGQGIGTQPWSRLSWDSAGLAPDPALLHEPVIQVYGARAWGWRGVFGEHTWVVFKPEGAPDWQRVEVVGWGVGRGASAVRRNLRVADGRWAGNEPRLLAELRGEAAAIDRLEAAIAAYPWPDRYRTWPGPNSNTFVAHLARELPELRLHLPPTAVGKDFLGNHVLARTPSGTGWQLSLYGLAGVSVGVSEGLELNLLGLTLGLDPLGLAVKLPGIGRLGLL
jgi:hypothetical protein